MKRILILAIGAVSATSFAGGNLVQNGDFSAQTYTPNSYDTITAANAATYLPDWSLVGQNVAGIGIGYFYGKSQEIDVSGISDNAALTTGISQVLNTHAGSTYTLTFDLFTGAPGYTGSVTVFAGGTALGTNLQGGSYNSTTQTQSPLLESFTFTATGSQTNLEFLDGSAPTPPQGGPVSQISNVSVTAPAPPAYFAMGLPMLLILRRRAKK